ncbi:hypothetical protein CASFOL_029513 [Castilleja foliolosa]|uniref:Clp R domain-containing protein n=1 Tax=Castilleja foliolosa TaxID=1961234 RepID=A0ABD3C8Q4_9LAMI
MRARACSVPQTLSPEAASVLKHSLVLARRRGHSHLTPLHVAATLLTSSSRFSSTLRRAYLKSSSPSSSSSTHPDLQCRALELCFNVALNRLPATAAPLLLHAPPPLSNALIAALKRAQAHQRRTGSAEQQQQLQQQQNCIQVAIRVDLDQLILSILDDPSVSRVMREAGFSSTLVKSDLEDCRNMNTSVSAFLQNLSSCMDKFKVVYDVLLGNTKKNIVLVGDSSEGLADEVTSKLEKGDIDVPEELRSVKLIRLQFSAVPLRFMKKQEVDMNVGDLRRKVESFGLDGRVVIYIGDLKWAVEGGGVGDEYTVDYLIEEIGKLVYWFNNNNSSSMRVWLMANANYETYMKCKMKQPSLDVQWDLEAVFVPSTSSGGIGLSINDTSGLGSRFTSKSYLCPKEEQDNGSAQLPHWLRPHANKTLVKGNQNPGSTLPRFRRLPQSSHVVEPVEPNLDSLKTMEGKEVKITLSLGNLSALDDEGVSVNGDVIRENVPWQFETIPLILEAINGDRLVLIKGEDVVGKRRLAVGLAKSMFGSSNLLFYMNMMRNNDVSENREMLEMALRDRENIVVLVEDVDYADPEFVEILVDKKNCCCRAIFILTTGGDTRCNVTRDGLGSVIQMKLVVQESKHGLRVSNFDRKRKSGWDDMAVRVNNQKKKFNEMELEVSSNGGRELNSNALDLNLRAGDDDDDQQGVLSPISSDLTRETTFEQPNLLAILKKIKNLFVFNRDSGKDERAREMLLSKFKRSFHEATGYVSCFEVDDSALEQVLQGSGFYLNDLFEKWLKDVFRTSLTRMVGVGDHREKVSVRLCLDEKLGDNCEKEGFMGTCLPKCIQF